MNEIKKEKIRLLAIDALHKREKINGLGGNNVQTDPAAKEQQAVDYAWAMADSLEADHLLKMEIYPFGVKPVESQNQA